MKHRKTWLGSQRAGLRGGSQIFCPSIYVRLSGFLYSRYMDEASTNTKSALKIVAADSLAGHVWGCTAKRTSQSLGYDWNGGWWFVFQSPSFEADSRLRSRLNNSELFAFVCLLQTCGAALVWKSHQPLRGSDPDGSPLKRGVGWSGTPLRQLRRRRAHAILARAVLSDP
jgi:hypothetical protein